MKMGLFIIALVLVTAGFWAFDDFMDRTEATLTPVD